MTDIPDGFYRCARCGHVGPPHDFARNRAVARGHAYRCLRCNAEIVAAWKRLNPAMVRAGERRRYLRRKVKQARIVN